MCVELVMERNASAENAIRIDDILRDVVTLTAQVKYLAADLGEAKIEIKRIQEEQDGTSALLNRGRGAIYVLTALGAIVGMFITWGKDILRPWVHP